MRAVLALLILFSMIAWPCIAADTLPYPPITKPLRLEQFPGTSIYYSIGNAGIPEFRPAEVAFVFESKDCAGRNAGGASSVARLAKRPLIPAPWYWPDKSKADLHQATRNSANVSTGLVARVANGVAANAPLPSASYDSTPVPVL